MAAADMVMEQYPQLAFLLNDPEIGPLLLQAVDPNAGFDANTFQSKLQATNWFRSRSQQARETEIQRYTDPQTLAEREWDYVHELNAVASELGVQLNDAQVSWFTAIGMNQGLAANSQRMKDYVASLVDPGRTMQGYGTPGAAKNAVENLIRGEWFAPIADPNWLAQAGLKVATGKETLESINAQLASQAWNMYPHLRQQITEGQTMADIFNPYRQVIAEELELGDIENVSMNNTEWSQLMQWRDPKTVELRLPTTSEVQTLARSRPQWWQTSKGREADAGGTRALLQMFGAVK